MPNSNSKSANDSSIIKKYRKHFLWADLVVSLIFIIIIFLIMNYFYSFDTINNWISLNKAQLYPTIATIAGTLLGFVITGISIIIAFSESEKLKHLRKSKHYKTIFDVYFSTIRYLALATVFPLIGIVINSDWSYYILFLIIWAIMISSFRIWRCIWILESIISILS